MDPKVNFNIILLSILKSLMFAPKYFNAVQILPMLAVYFSSLILHFVAVTGT
jgi:hypothetical protein